MAHRDNISRVYKDIHEDDKSVVSVETTTGLWSGDTSSLSTFYTSGTQLAKEGGAKYFVIFFALKRGLEKPYILQMKKNRPPLMTLITCSRKRRFRTF